MKYKRLYMDVLTIIEKIGLTKKGEPYRHMNQFMKSTRHMRLFPVQPAQNLGAILGYWPLIPSQARRKNQGKMGLGSRRFARKD
jgi:hypothetical protein